MPFQAATIPVGVTVASGSVDRKNRAIVTGLPTVPPALMAVSMMPGFGEVSLAHRTCRIPSLPRASPMSSMRFVPAGVTLDHVAAATAGVPVPAAATPPASKGTARQAALARARVARIRTVLRGMVLLHGLIAGGSAVSVRTWPPPGH